MSSSQTLSLKYTSIARELESLELEENDIVEILQLVDNKVNEQFRRNDPEIQEMESRLRKSLDSLTSNEQEYVNNLQTIVKTYFNPIRSGVVKMKTQAMITIFSNIEVLCGLHLDMLKKLIQAKENFPKTKVADLFEEFVPSMQVYTQYVNHFSASLAELEAERKKSKAFNQFLISCEESNPMPLDALLSFPLNRIPHYRGALMNILQSTPRNGPDYSKLVKVTDDLTELQEYLNQSKTQSDNMGKVYEVETKIIGREYALNDIHRAFVKEGPIQPNDKKSKDHYGFLFNDVLVLTKKIPQKIQYRFKQMYSLQYGSISSEGLVITLNNPTTKEKLSLVAPNVEAKKEWMVALTKVITNMENTRIFGSTIAEIMKKEPEGREVPTLVTDLLSQVEKNASVPGIFRISGSSNTINSTISQIDRGIKVNIAELDCHVVSGLFKQFLRTLAEPLIPFDMFERFLDCHGAEDSLSEVKKVLSDLPAPNYNIIKHLLRSLEIVASQSSVNKMTPSNLAIVIGPNLAREKVTSTFGEISLTTKVSPLVEIMIKNIDDIFPKDVPKFSKAVPRSAALSSKKLGNSGGLMGSRRQGRKLNNSASMSSTVFNQRKKAPPPRPPPRRGTSNKSEIMAQLGKKLVEMDDNLPKMSPPSFEEGAQQQNTDPSPPKHEENIPSNDAESNQQDLKTESKEPEVTQKELEDCCVRCRNSLGEEFIEVFGKTWHPECFLCTLCSSDLSNGYFQKDGNPICKPCRRALRASRRAKTTSSH